MDMFRSIPQIPGEPGRDAGCNVSGMGTVAIIPLQQNLTFVNIARIKTTKVELYPGSKSRDSQPAPSSSSPGRLRVIEAPPGPRRQDEPDSGMD